MSHTIEQLLADIQGRKQATRWGIGTASQYVKSLVPCLDGGGVCPVREFSLASADEWQKSLSEAESKFTFSDDSMIVKGFSDGADITPGAVLEYDCTLIARTKDRDGDVLEPAGFTLDTKMPLLWQHLQVQPIGKFVAEITAEGVRSSRIDCKFAIADTELGRDAATLVKFGALRKSHGFKPQEFNPIVTKDANGQERISGWHVLKGTTMEGSLVSIPANSSANIHTVYAKEFDGICTAFGEKKLKSAVVQSWAKSIYDTRPVVGKGADFHTDDADSDPAERYVFNELAERWQDRQTGKYVKAADVAVKGGMSSESDSAAGCKCGKCGTNCKCSKCSHKSTESEMNGVRDVPSDTQPQDSGWVQKAGKVLSAANTAKLKSAIAQLQEVLATAGERDDDTKRIVLYAAKSLNLDTKSLYGLADHVRDSWEWVQDKLASKAELHLKSKLSDMPSDCYVQLVATFDGVGVVCCRSWGMDGKRNDPKCYSIGWNTDDEGAPMWDGEPTEVEVSATAIAKHISDLRAKSAIESESFTAPQGSDELTLDQLTRKLLAKSLRAGYSEFAKSIGMIREAETYRNEQREARAFESLFCLESDT